jgi:ribosomal protein S18 acetylase RimI-like enzyme
MESQVVEQNYVYEISISKGNKCEQDQAKGAIERINGVINWSEDNEEIYHVLVNQPKFCYFAKFESDIVGYVILREDGEDELKHLHVSWIATDLLNRGIGSLLMQKVINKNRKLGYKVLTLHFRKNNTKLRRFYEKIAELEAVKFLCEERDDSVHCRVTYEM